MPGSSSSYFSKVFGTSLKPPYSYDDPDGAAMCSRIDDTKKFLNWSWWPFLTPWAKSSIFSRRGYHVKVFVYLIWGVFAFFANFAMSFDHDFKASGLSGRLLTFMLSSYVSILVNVYWINVRKKSRNMLYGLSNSVDTLVTVIDYDHPNANRLLRSIHGAMTAIGQYSIAIASKMGKFKLSKQQTIAMFKDRGLDGEYLTKLPPKQAMHVLRLAILQEINDERYKRNDESHGGSCLHRITPEDFIELRKQMNAYSGWASSTSSSVSSSKLPYCYVEFINVATHALGFFSMYQFVHEEAAIWSDKGICPQSLPLFTCHPGEIEPNGMDFFHLVMFFAFHVVILYFIFGCLEIFYVLSDSWASGLVVQNYKGIIELICLPLHPSRNDDDHVNKRPIKMDDIKLKKKQDNRNNSDDFINNKTETTVSSAFDSKRSSTSPSLETVTTIASSMTNCISNSNSNSNSNTTNTSGNGNGNGKNNNNTVNITHHPLYLQNYQGKNR